MRLLGAPQNTGIHGPPEVPGAGGGAEWAPVATSPALKGRSSSPLTTTDRAPIVHRDIWIPVAQANTDLRAEARQGGLGEAEVPRAGYQPRRPRLVGRGAGPDA